MADINSTGGLRDLFASKLKETDFNGQRRVTAGLDDEKSGQDRVAITSVLFRTSSSQQYYLNIGARGLNKLSVMSVSQKDRHHRRYSPHARQNAFFVLSPTDYHSFRILNNSRQSPTKFITASTCPATVVKMMTSVYVCPHT